MARNSSKRLGHRDFDEGAALHWPGTESASVVMTTTLREVRAAFNTLVGHGGVVLVDGPPGLGKTFATDLSLQSLELEKLWIAMPDRPRGKETTARVHQALTSSRPAMHRVTEFELLEENVELLAGRPVALVIDEAQHLPTGSLRQLRYLHDRPETQLTLGLVGAAVDAAVRRRCPELYNRVDRRVAFKPLSGRETRDAVSDYHELFANSKSGALIVCWEAAGGRLRDWAKLLKAALALGIEPRKGMTKEQARAVCRAVYGDRQSKSQRPADEAVWQEAAAA